MIKTIEFKGVVYPAFQAAGFASKFAFPFAKEVCKGRGVDVGCNRLDWAFPGADPVDPNINTLNALRFESNQKELDYIFSSHCLEHIEKWVDVLDYWHSRLRKGGVLFLYLPDFSQEYWKPWHNRKHVNAFTPEIIRSYFKDKGFKNFFCSGIDLNNSFMIFGEK
jgi:predicted SAM-dependent methyltransferase